MGSGGDHQLIPISLNCFFKELTVLSIPVSVVVFPHEEQVNVYVPSLAENTSLVFSFTFFLHSGLAHSPSKSGFCFAKISTNLSISIASHPKLEPQLLQCQVLLTLPAAKTPNSATLATFFAPLILAQLVDWQKGQWTRFIPCNSLACRSLISFAFVNCLYVPCLHFLHMPITNLPDSSIESVIVERL